MAIIDLHIHSSYSDGSMTPKEIIDLAIKRDIGALAITDHDTVAGVDEAEAYAAQTGIGFLPGMEITAQYHGRKLHLVALRFDRKCPEFREFYHKIRSVREERIGEIIAGINDMGVDISLEKVKACTPGVLDRYAIMRYLMTLKLAPHAQTLWDNYINPVVKSLHLSIDISAEEAVKAIKASGGITSLAHYHKRIGLQGMSPEEQENVIATLKGYGLDGIEQWYPTFSDKHIQFVSDMTEKYQLLNTGGTDFHGANRPGIELGTGIGGNLAIPYEVYSIIKCGGENNEKHNPYC